jgi:hypothetical protein
MGVLAKLREKLSLAQKRDAGEVVSKFKTVTEFLSDAFEAGKDNGVLIGVAKALPWADIGVATAESLPVLKFFYTLVEKLTEVKDPDELGYLACTVAYQRSVEQAIEKLKWTIKPKEPSGPLREALDRKLSDLADFSTFSFETALLHRFVMEADDALIAFAEALHVEADEVRKLVGAVHDVFVTNLKEILATEKKLANFKERIELGTQETRTARALGLHAEYQAWQFENRPLFGREAFSLRDIYVEGECGLLRWEQIRRSRSHEEGPKPKALDPFVEKNGGRETLIETVLRLMADKDFDDAIVIQGVAGSGKSTFTLRLCSELVRRGLRPIRVRLNDLPLDESPAILPALARALRYYDSDRSPHGTGDFPLLGDDPFRDGAVFNDQVTFTHGEWTAPISRYVLILDAWDELTVGVSGNLHDRVELVLRRVRSEFLTRPPHIRVILTGRPSAAVEESGFLRPETRVLTIRPLGPPTLRALVEKLGPLLAGQGQDGARTAAAFDIEKFKEVFRVYQEYHDEIVKSGSVPSDSGPLGVLGLPLLTQLVLRLALAEDVNVATLIDDTTTLYRRLTDLTCAEAGQPKSGEEPSGEMARFKGWELRRLLRHTASAITITGKESISRLEWESRLEDLEPRAELLEEWVHGDERAAGDSSSGKDRLGPLAKLVVSYYFHTAHDQAGCEFAHKSFREYLFAEAIVEELKEHSQQEGIHEKLGRRSPFWRDFDKGDRRHSLSRRLGLLLAPVWLSPEVEKHVANLIAWEAGCAPAAAAEKDGPFKAMPTDPIEPGLWAVIRDDLADLWEWWGEGVHLRPQIELKAREIKDRDRPIYAVDLVNWSLPRDFNRSGKFPPAPPRTVTVDAHLGAGLLLLNILTHDVAARSALPETSEAALLAKGEALEERIPPPRPYQSAWKTSADTLIRFRPSSGDQYLRNYMARINAAGWCPRGEFPSGVDLRGADLSGADLNGAVLRGADLSRADLSGADLSRAYLGEADLRRADLRRAHLSGADLSRAYLGEADLSRAVLSRADLSRAVLSRADLRWTNGLTQDQVESAVGNGETKLHEGLSRPSSWPV